MASSKRKIKNTTEILIFAFLVLFPFGQIIRINLNLLGSSIVLHPIDLIAGVGLFIFLMENFKKPKIFGYLLTFLGVALFSYLLSFAILGGERLYVGGLYLFRLFAYTSFFLLAWNTAKNDKKYSKKLLGSLIYVVLAVSLFGFLQYFIYPDITTFTIWGWDDHYYRLLGTFLDPGHTSIILVFGFLAALVKYLEEKNKRLLPILGIILISIAFTYSRAGYLALVSGIFVVAFVKKNTKLLITLISLFALTVILLPRPGGEGVKLERTASIALRIEDYGDTLSIFKKAPLFGVGYNNMCLARTEYLSQFNPNSHACSGSASSLLLILATTGILGLIVFIKLIGEIVSGLAKNVYGITFLSCLVALLVHSMFVNSLLYPWVMGWMGLLLSISMKTTKE